MSYFVIFSDFKYLSSRDQIEEVQSCFPNPFVSQAYLRGIPKAKLNFKPKIIDDTFGHTWGNQVQ